MNEIIIDILNNIAIIITKDKKNNINGKFLIDINDIEKIKNFKWTLLKNQNGDNYCRCNENHNCILLHRLLMNVHDRNKFVDHINGNSFDNRKCNLRIVTNQQNQFNSHNKGSGNNNRKGVSYRKDRNKWRAYITINRKQITLGLFETEQEAIDARIKAEEEYFGEYKRGE